MAIQKYKLTNDEVRNDFTNVAVFDYTDIANNATSSNQVTIATIPAGGAVELVYVWEETALAGATDITLDVGTTGADPDEFIDALDVDAMTVPVFNTGDLMVKTAATTTFLGGNLPVSSVAADTPILAEWNGTVANLTAGRVFIGIRLIEPDRFFD